MPPAPRRYDRISPGKHLLVILSHLLPGPMRFRLLGLPAGEVNGDPKGQVPGYSVEAGPAGHVHQLPNGIAWSRGAHLDEHFRLIHALSRGITHGMDYWMLKRQRFLPKVQPLPEETVSLVTDGDTNYFHWLFDVLPKLAAFDPKPLPDRHFLCCAQSPFHLETLGLNGIEAGHVISTRSRSFYQAPRLLVPEAPAGPTPETIRFLRERMAQNPRKPLPPSPNGPRIYITRRFATSRRLHDEAVLLERLGPLGFSAVAPEKLSVAEQISLFHHAEVIIAPTGAALANLAFCAPGTRVLIFMPQGCEDYLYRDIGQAADLTVTTQIVPLAPGGPPDPLKSDLLLGPAGLASIEGSLREWGVKS